MENADDFKIEVSANRKGYSAYYSLSEKDVCTACSQCDKEMIHIQQKISILEILDARTMIKITKNSHLWRLVSKIAKAQIQEEYENAPICYKCEQF